MSEQDTFSSPYDPKPKKKKRPRRSATKKQALPSDSEQDGEKDDGKLVSYRLGSALQTRIREVAKTENVIQAELVRYLLTRGLDALESGDWELPKVAPEPKRMKIKL